MTSQIRLDVPLADLTSMRVGGLARDLVEVHTSEELIEAVSTADTEGIPLLVLAGGSNVVIADEGFAGRVVLVRSRGVESDVTDCYGAWVSVAAGESWSDLVALAVEEEWVGIEALAGIPGSVGATPVQNVGAYGQEVASTIARVEVYDRQTRRREVIPVADCGFSYRTSRFKGSDRFVILSVAFQFKRGNLSEAISYLEVARTLGVEIGARVPMTKLRDAVLELRASKGMVLDEADRDTWSSGSFFLNPIVSTDFALPVEAPTWANEEGVKVSAAWLIQQAGFGRGFALAGSRAAISSKHTLAITNRGGATTREVLDLARTIKTGVHTAFGITLLSEPTLVGCEL
jgi:UDP-N-acetylmuramate dehydrogenase